MPNYIEVIIQKNGRRVRVRKSAVDVVQELEDGPGCTVVANDGSSVYNVRQSYDEVCDMLDEVKHD